MACVLLLVLLKLLTTTRSTNHMAMHIAVSYDLLMWASFYSVAAFENIVEFLLYCVIMLERPLRERETPSQREREREREREHLLKSEKRLVSVVTASLTSEFITHISKTCHIVASTTEILRCLLWWCHISRLSDTLQCVDTQWDWEAITFIKFCSCYVHRIRWKYYRCNCEYCMSNDYHSAVSVLLGCKKFTRRFFVSAAMIVYNSLFLRWVL